MRGWPLWRVVWNHRCGHSHGGTVRHMRVQTKLACGSTVLPGHQHHGAAGLAVLQAGHLLPLVFPYFLPGVGGSPGLLQLG